MSMNRLWYVLVELNRSDVSRTDVCAVEAKRCKARLW